MEPLHLVFLTGCKRNADGVSKSQHDCCNQQQVQSLPVPVCLSLSQCLIKIMFANVTSKVSTNSTICSDTKFIYIIPVNDKKPASSRLTQSLMNLCLPCSSLFLDFISMKPVAIETWLYYASLYYFLWKALATHILHACAWIEKCCLSNKH